MIASLPMYDRPETRAANDRLWDLIRSGLPDHLDAPDHLTRSADPMADWDNPALLFSQTCSLPYRARFKDKLTIVGTPIHALAAPAGYYYSALIARADDPRETLADFENARLAINDPLSQSGWAAVHALNIPFMVSAITGAHAASARAVAETHAELAAIDAVTWELLRRSDPMTTRLRVIERTEPTPALPYVTATAHGEIIATALKTAIARLSDDDKKTLCLEGLTRLPDSAYLDQPIPPAPN